MLSARYLLDHIDALIRLSQAVQDRTASAKLREMADELRIMVSVADVTDLVATLRKNVVPESASAKQKLPSATSAKSRRKNKNGPPSSAVYPAVVERPLPRLKAAGSRQLAGSK